MGWLGTFRFAKALFLHRETGLFVEVQEGCPACCFEELRLSPDDLFSIVD